MKYDTMPVMMIDEVRMTKLFTPRRIRTMRPLKKPLLVSITAVLLYSKILHSCGVSVRCRKE
jgi:hypothetical protein